MNPCESCEVGSSPAVVAESVHEDCSPDFLAEAGIDSDDSVGDPCYTTLSEGDDDWDDDHENHDEEAVSSGSSSEKLV